MLSRLACLSLLLLVDAPAQTGGEPTRDGNASEPRAGIRFVCTSLPDHAPEELALLLDAKTKKTVKVPLFRRKPGDYLPLPVGGEIRLGQLPDADHTPFKTFALAKKPVGSRRLLGILVPASPKATTKGKPPFHLQVIDESAFSLGDFYFINLTPLEIGIRFDGTQFKIKPNGRKHYEPRQLNEARNSPVIVSFRSLTPPSKWQPLTRSTWRLRPTRKEICLFYWDELHQRPAMRGLTVFEPTTGS